jgi:hypothetical protein
VWIDNWQRMLPPLVATRGLVSPSLLTAIERFVVVTHGSSGDPNAAAIQNGATKNI